MTDIHPSLRRRKIIHVDMDAYYAAIEARDRPELRGKPLIVGGKPNSRGVVCTASYEARRFGVRSAMSCAKAARLCPEGIFVPPRFERYREVSEQLRAVMRRYTDLLEPLSLDEAYLDVTVNAGSLFAVEIARRVRAEIFQDTGLTASAGVAPNKMLAKIASDLNKPNGIAVIVPEQVAEFMRSLPLHKIHGIGPVTAARLAAQGLHACGEVAAMARDELVRRLGAHFGGWLHDRAHGIDERPVETSRQRKSWGSETTFPKDLTAPAEIAAALGGLAAELAESLQDACCKGQTVTVKARYPDFTSVTRAETLAHPTNGTTLIVQTALRLLARTDAATRGVRLLGVSLTKLVEGDDADAAPSVLPGAYVQPSLFGD